jgi:hypothetical protein
MKSTPSVASPPAALPLLALLLALLPACTSPSRGGFGDDDDDSAQGDDDDASGDDDTADDDTSDDDDTPVDDDDTPVDDDDDATPPDDDDDDSVDPGTAFVDQTYCLDWDTVNVTQPTAWSSLAAFVDPSQYPLLLSPTAVNVPAGQIWMMGGIAQMGTCVQDTTASTVDLTGATPGSYTAPSFAVGPADMSMTTSVGALTVYDTVITGDFTGTADQIVDSTIYGMADITAFSSVACMMITCVSCPTGTGDCMVFSADSAVWDNTGAGPMTVVP